MSKFIPFPLEKVTEVLDSQRVPISEQERAFRVGDIPYYGANGLQGFIDDWIFDEELILIAEDGGYFDEYLTRPIAYRISGKSWVNNHAHVLRVNENFCFDFLFYCLQHKNINPFIKGGTRAKLNQKELKGIVVNIPANLRVQQKIARILQTVDQAIEKTEQLIEKYQQIKAGLMHDLFTRGIEADGQLRLPREQAPELYQHTPIGWIPKEWELTTCEEVCEKVIDCKNRTPPITPDGFPVIRTPNVRDGQFVDLELVYTDLESYKIWTARGKPVPGDIVITREAPVGEVCKIPDRHPEACLGQRMMLYRPDIKKIDSDFFLYALQSVPIQNRLDLISGGSTVGHVRVGDIRSLWIFKPENRLEQEIIAGLLISATQHLDRDRVTLDKLLKQKSGLMHDLLTGTVPVSVDSASEVSA